MVSTHFELDPVVLPAVQELLDAQIEQQDQVITVEIPRPIEATLELLRRYEHKTHEQEANEGPVWPTTHHLLPGENGKPRLYEALCTASQQESFATLAASADPDIRGLLLAELDLTLANLPAADELAESLEQYGIALLPVDEESGRFPVLVKRENETDVYTISLPPISCPGDALDNSQETPDEQSIERKPESIITPQIWHGRALFLKTKNGPGLYFLEGEELTDQLIEQIKLRKQELEEQGLDLEQLIEEFQLQSQEQFITDPQKRAEHQAMLEELDAAGQATLVFAPEGSKEEWQTTFQLSADKLITDFHQQPVEQPKPTESDDDEETIPIPSASLPLNDKKSIPGVQIEQDASFEDWFFADDWLPETTTISILETLSVPVSDSLSTSSPMEAKREMLHIPYISTAPNQSVRISLHSSSPHSEAAAETMTARMPNGDEPQVASDTFLTPIEVPITFQEFPIAQSEAAFQKDAIEESITKPRPVIPQPVNERASQNLTRISHALPHVQNGEFSVGIRQKNSPAPTRPSIAHIPTRIRHSPRSPLPSQPSLGVPTHSKEQRAVRINTTTQQTKKQTNVIAETHVTTEGRQMQTRAKQHSKTSAKNTSSIRALKEVAIKAEQAQVHHQSQTQSRASVKHKQVAQQVIRVKTQKQRGIVQPIAKTTTTSTAPHQAVRRVRRSQATQQQQVIAAPRNKHDTARSVVSQAMEHIDTNSLTLTSGDSPIHPSRIYPLGVVCADIVHAANELPSLHVTATITPGVIHFQPSSGEPIELAAFLREFAQHPAGLSINRSSLTYRLGV